MLAERISPDVVTYGSMISVANKLGQADAADGWLQRAIKEKVAPNKICFGMVISALATASSIDAATQRLDDMVGNGTNAGLGLEVPLAHGKFLTNGLGGTVPVSKEARAQRAKAANFPGFMGEEFGYLWEREDGYLGNAGFIYGVLLTDPDLQVDMLQHPVSQADRQTVRANHPEMADALDLEAAALKAGVSQSYAASIAGLVNGGQRFGAANRWWCTSTMGEKPGIAMMVTSFAFPLPLVLLNGAEPPAPMDVGKTPGFGPDFAELGRQCVGHPKVPRLVLTSHGSEASGAVRRAAMSSAQEASQQSLVLCSSLDHRCASRSFPQMGGREGELEELMGALAKANVVLQEKQAGNRFSMRPTNAKRVWSTGHFSVECREDLCRLLLDLELLRSTSTPAISKQQAVMLMNRTLDQRCCFWPLHWSPGTLRYCPALALEQIRPWREAFRALLGDLIEELRSLSPKLRQEELGDLTPLLQRFRQRLALGVERHNTFTDLQKEVNAILSFLPSRT
eukprot:g9972.t1